MFLHAGKKVTPTLSSLIHHSPSSCFALEALVEEIHNNKELTCYQLINHPRAESIIYGIIHMIGSPITSVSGNAAYVIGSLCDLGVIRRKVIDLVTQQTFDDTGLLTNLTKLLNSKDAESRMNASGAIATLAENSEGRCWLLRNPALDDTIARVAFLLTADEMWAASNCSLVIGRLAIDEEGCARILNRRDSKKILTRLVKALSCDEAGRGMNSGFAIGRLCDMPSGRKQVLRLKQRDLMLHRLIEMLQYQDIGCKKNASFALSSIATSDEGHAIVLQHPKLKIVLDTLMEIMKETEEETTWFATMLIRTLASKRQGCLMLRDQHELINTLKSLLEKEDVNEAVRNEVVLALEIMKRLEKPSPVTVRVESAFTAVAMWEAINPRSGLEVTYHLFEGNKEIYTGEDTSMTINDLKPMSHYTYRLRVSTEGDMSPMSNAVHISTPETVPGAPQRFQVISRNTSILKIGWDPPEECNGLLKGYHLVKLNQLGVIDFQLNTTSQSHIFSHLAAGTQYELRVCAVTSAGSGDPAILLASTMDLKEHAPPVPNLAVLGSNEIYVSWEPPAGPVARINRYEVIMNGESVYRGIERSCSVRGLEAKKEYTFTVTAWTSEGRCTSKPATKRTAPTVTNKSKQSRLRLRAKSMMSINGKNARQPDPIGRPITTMPLKREKTRRTSYPNTKIPALVETKEQRVETSESIVKLEFNQRNAALQSSVFVLEEKLGLRAIPSHPPPKYPRPEDKLISAILNTPPGNTIKGPASPTRRDFPSPIPYGHLTPMSDSLSSTFGGQSIGGSSAVFSQALDDLNDPRQSGSNGFHTSASRTSWRPKAGPLRFMDRKPDLF